MYIYACSCFPMENEGEEKVLSIYTICKYVYRYLNLYTYIFIYTYAYLYGYFYLSKDK